MCLLSSDFADVAQRLADLGCETHEYGRLTCPHPLQLLRALGAPIGLPSDMRELFDERHRRESEDTDFFLYAPAPAEGHEFEVARLEAAVRLVCEDLAALGVAASASFNCCGPSEHLLGQVDVDGVALRALLFPAAAEPSDPWAM